MKYLEDILYIKRKIKNYQNNASIILINTSDRFLEVIFGHPILLDHGKNNFGMEIIKINY